MPVKKYRDVSEMEGNTWLEPGSPELTAAIREVWAFAHETTKPCFPPGVYKHRSIEEANALSEEWDRANFERFHADRARKTSEPEAGSEPDRHP